MKQFQTIIVCMLLIFVHVSCTSEKQISPNKKNISSQELSLNVSIGDSFLRDLFFIDPVIRGGKMEKIAIISTRLGGIDGVSIEADKWANAYKRIGLDPVYIAGKFDREDNSIFFAVDEMDYYFTEVAEIRKIAFNEEKKATENDLGR